MDLLVFGLATAILLNVLVPCLRSAATTTGAMDDDHTASTINGLGSTIDHLDEERFIGTVAGNRLGGGRLNGRGCGLGGLDGLLLDGGLARDHGVGVRGRRLGDGRHALTEVDALLGVRLGDHDDEEGNDRGDDGDADESLQCHDSRSPLWLWPVATNPLDPPEGGSLFLSTTATTLSDDDILS